MPQRGYDLNVNNSVAKVNKSSIEDIGFTGSYDTRGRIGAISGQ